MNITIDAHTLEIAKTVGSFSGAAVALIGFYLVLRQLRLNRSALESQARASIYNLSFSVHKMLVDNPGLWKYFFAGEPIPEQEPLRSQVLAAGEVLLDFFEHITHCRDLVEEDLYGVWRAHIGNVHQSSPACAHIVDSRPHHFTRALRDMLASPAAGAAPSPGT